MPLPSVAAARHILALLAEAPDSVSDYVRDLVQAGEFVRASTQLSPTTALGRAVAGQPGCTYGAWMTSGSAQLAWQESDRESAVAREGMVLIKDPDGDWLAYRDDIMAILELHISLAELATRDQASAIAASFRALARHARVELEDTRDPASRVEALRLEAVRDRLERVLQRGLAYGDDAEDLAHAVAALGARADHPYTSDPLIDLYEHVRACQPHETMYVAGAAHVRLAQALVVWSSVFGEIE